MKFTVDRLQVGELVKAEVVESVSSTELIVSFHGDLVRIRNASFRKLSMGDIVELRVIQLHPLKFHLVTDEEKKSRSTRMNVTA